MKKIIRSALILALITAICVALCALVNSFTSPVIKENLSRENLAAYKEVSLSMEMGEERDGEGNVKKYLPLYKDGVLSGYALTLQGKGYGGVFTIVSSFNTNGELLKAKMTEDGETAGLGKKAEKDEYMNIFVGMGGKVSFPNGKNDLDGSDRELVSGATVTLKGVLGAFREGSEFVKRIGEKNE